MNEDQIIVSTDPSYEGDASCTTIWRKNADGTIHLLAVWHDTSPRNRLRIRWDSVIAYTACMLSSITLALMWELPMVGMIGAMMLGVVTAWTVVTHDGESHD